MNGSQLAIDTSILQADQLRKTLKKGATRQVNTSQERAIVKSTALSWFNNLRPEILLNFNDTALEKIDQLYNYILAGSDRSISRTEYIKNLKVLKELLVNLRSESVLMPTGTSSRKAEDAPPDFSRLVVDPKMQEILKRRWNECTDCIEAGATLAATVMMGGLLEALLLARVNREKNKAPIFKAISAPKDKEGHPLQLKDWGLSNYIDVAHELGWISQSAKGISVVLRDYRNYVHPYKELSHGVKLEKSDALILWGVAKSISSQILTKT